MTKGILFSVGALLAILGTFAYKKHLSSFRKRATTPSTSSKKGVEDESAAGIPAGLLLDDDEITSAEEE
jgi:hypothetical protein